MNALRFLGGLFLLAAVIALTYDVTRTGSGWIGATEFTSLAKHWADLSPQTLAAAQKAVETRAHPLVWDPVIRSVLDLPAWASLGAIGAVALWLGRPRRRVDIFIN